MVAEGAEDAAGRELDEEWIIDIICVRGACGNGPQVDPCGTVVGALGRSDHVVATREGSVNAEKTAIGKPGRPRVRAGTKDDWGTRHGHSPLLQCLRDWGGRSREGRGAHKQQKLNECGDDRHRNECGLQRNVVGPAPGNQSKAIYLSKRSSGAGNRTGSKD